MIRPRSAWGAAPPTGSYSWLPNQVGIAVHWEGPHMGAYTQADVPGLIRGIQRYHQHTQGWSDIAYNFVVDRYGGVWEGRGWNARSAANGTNTSNSGYLAVCYLGGEGDDFTAAAAGGISSLVTEHLARGGLPDVTGHRDHTPTACPGDTIYQWVRSGGPLNAAPFQPATPPSEDDLPLNDADKQWIAGTVESLVTRRTLAMDGGVVGALTPTLNGLADQQQAIINLLQQLAARPAPTLDPATVVDELLRRIRAT